MKEPWWSLMKEWQSLLGKPFFITFYKKINLGWLGDSKMDSVTQVG